MDFISKTEVFAIGQVFVTQGCQLGEASLYFVPSAHLI